MAEYNGNTFSLTDADRAEERDILKAVRRGGAAASIVTALIGGLLVFAPAFTGLLAAYLITGGFTIYGVFKILSYFGTPAPLRSGFMLADGILTTLLGGMILADALTGGADGRASMIATLAFAAGFISLFNGVSQLGDSIALGREGWPGAGAIALGGALRIVLGAVIIAAPFIGWFSMQICLGIFLMVSAIALFIETRAISSLFED